MTFRQSQSQNRCIETAETRMHLLFLQVELISFSIFTSVERSEIDPNGIKLQCSPSSTLGSFTGATKYSDALKMQNRDSTHRPEQRATESKKLHVLTWHRLSIVVQVALSSFHRCCYCFCCS